MSYFDEMVSSSSEIQSAFENGIQPIPTGEYRLILGDFKSLPERKSVVLKFLVLANGDGSETEYKGRSVELWLNFGSATTANIARSRTKDLGLSSESFRDDVTGKLSEIISLRATIKQDRNPKTDAVQNAIAKVLEIITREPQDVEVDSLEAY
jgi:hypothetical protein